jgi:hypothetical protein
MDTIFGHLTVLGILRTRIGFILVIQWSPNDTYRHGAGPKGHTALGARAIRAVPHACQADLGVLAHKHPAQPAQARLTHALALWRSKVCLFWGSSKIPKRDKITYDSTQSTLRHALACMCQCHSIGIVRRLGSDNLYCFFGQIDDDKRGQPICGHIVWCQAIL